MRFCLFNNGGGQPLNKMLLDFMSIGAKIKTTLIFVLVSGYKCEYHNKNSKVGKPSK